MSHTKQEICSCKRKGCERHGRCKECRTYHREHSHWPVYCERELAKYRSARKKDV